MMQAKTLQFISNMGIAVQPLGGLWWLVGTLFFNLSNAVAYPNGPWWYFAAPLPFALPALGAAQRPPASNSSLYRMGSLISLIVAVVILLIFAWIKQPRYAGY